MNIKHLNIEDLSSNMVMGKPCRKCSPLDDVIRYVSSNRCVMCKFTANQQRSKCHNTEV